MCPQFLLERGDSLWSCQGTEPLLPPGLWYEYAILRKLLYRNKSQHRKTKYFQHLQAVDRQMRLLQSTECEDLSLRMVQAVQRGLANSGLPTVSMHRTLGWVVCECSVGSHGSTFPRVCLCLFVVCHSMSAQSAWHTLGVFHVSVACDRHEQRVLPSFQSAAFTLQRLHAAACIIPKLVEALQAASRHLMTELSHAYFVPLALTVLSILARIWVRQR